MRFAYRLAFRLGIANVREWLSTIDSRQFDEWVAFVTVDGWGDGLPPGEADAGSGRTQAGQATPQQAHAMAAQAFGFAGKVKI